jgi:hypothetical protein
MSQTRKPPLARTAPPLATADAELDRKIKAGIIAAAVLLMLAGLILGAAPTKIVLCLIGLITVQGLWRGAGELVGFVSSTLLAMLLAPSIGRIFEGPIGGLFGTSGILGRTISIALVGIVIIAAGTIAIGIAAKRFIKKRPNLERWNAYAGAGLGLIEGTLVGMAVLWGALALEPIAANEVAAANQNAAFAEPAQPSAVSKGVAAFADRIRGSALGGIAEATNPIEGGRLLILCNDFVSVARDETAFDYFVNTPVMKEIKELPSLNKALDRVRADPQLSALFNDQEVSTASVRTVLESKTILDIFDHTTVISDLSPKMDDLVRAIADAKSKIGQAPPKPPTPQRRR